jgi:DNA-directed RNA polymerase specialized sigma24 family protein
VISDRQLLTAAAARRRAKDRVRDLDDAFALLIVQARAEGRTARGLADLLGIGPSTVNDLTRRGEQLLEGK